jgi:hypothetical protein
MLTATIHVPKNDPLLLYIANNIDDINDRNIYLNVDYGSLVLSCEDYNTLDRTEIKQFLETGDISENTDKDYKKTQEGLFAQRDKARNSNNKPVTTEPVQDDKVELSDIEKMVSAKLLPLRRNKTNLTEEILNSAKAAILERK